jgi:hypothetical protein
VNNNGCSSQASAFISPIDTLTCIGAIDSDWQKACNWNPQVVHQQCNSVLILFTVNQPIISQVAACKIISIHSSNSVQLIVNNSAYLQIET